MLCHLLCEKNLPMQSRHSRNMNRKVSVLIFTTVSRQHTLSVLERPAHVLLLHIIPKPLSTSSLSQSPCRTKWLSDCRAFSTTFHLDYEDSVFMYSLAQHFLLVILCAWTSKENPTFSVKFFVWLQKQPSH